MNLTESSIEEIVSEEKANRNTYHSLCYFLLRMILSEE